MPFKFKVKLQICDNGLAAALARDAFLHQSLALRACSQQKCEAPEEAELAERPLIKPI